MTYVEMLLAERTNPHSRIRDDGGRWWGYPHRRGGTDAITAIVIHTTENDPSPATAVNVADWQAHRAPEPSSYHVLVDSDHTVRTIENHQVAFHVVGFNTPSLGLSFATRARLWGVYPEWDRLALARGAAQAREWSDLYGIPARWITRRQALNGVSGFVRHSTMDPDRRSDPGDRFPADEFLELVVRPAPEPAPDPEPSWLEELMADTEAADALDRLADATRQRAIADTAPLVADIRHQAGHDPDAASDLVWAERLVDRADWHDQPVTPQLIHDVLNGEG